MYPNIDLIYIIKTLEMNLKDLEFLEKKIKKSSLKNRRVRNKKKFRRTRKKKSK